MGDPVGTVAAGRDAVSELADYSGNNPPPHPASSTGWAERGLVTREPSTDDKRGVRVNLTPLGWSLKHLEDFHERVNALLLDASARKRLRC